ncbi:hypothetical protein [Streptomyces sp. MJM8645]|uniref:hypothetical protein n=1 Tax=Streptomycetaceae TaxID=2062 RepID=UPI00133187E5|nr:hypothetical protein [Streptomyces sp. MJM8645]
MSSDVAALSHESGGLRSDLGQVVIAQGLDGPGGHDTHAIDLGDTHLCGHRAQFLGNTEALARFDLQRSISLEGLVDGGEHGVQTVLVGRFAQRLGWVERVSGRNGAPSWPVMNAGAVPTEGPAEPVDMCASHPAVQSRLATP